jgi:L-ascorbate metabolism protein UlaG (beta-lactamase superfamily)
MIIEPIQKKGRFYNSDKESVFAKIKEIVSTFLYLFWQRKRKKKFFELDQNAIKQKWVQQPIFCKRSEKPIITWLGHSTFLIQLGNVNILTDPVFYKVSSFYPKISPFSFDVSTLPRIDVVLISHNHLDHLDKKSLTAIKKYQPHVIVPFGDEKLVKSLGFYDVEGLMWWELYSFNDIIFDFFPAKHWSGRNFYDFNRSLWGSWLISSDDYSIYFGGDTAYSSHFCEIGNNNAVDIALLPAGPHEPRRIMKDSHIASQEVVQSFLDLRGKHLIPMHWGTFKGGLDRFADPIDSLQNSWDACQEVKKKSLHILKFGQSIQF